MKNKNTIPTKRRHAKKKKENVFVRYNKNNHFLLFEHAGIPQTKRMMRQLIFPFSILLAMKRYIINVLYYTAVSALYFVKEWLIPLKKELAYTPE